MSITAGSYSTVASFVEKYITSVPTLADLGCGYTNKVVGSLAYTKSDTSMYQLTEIHWVDSTVFPDKGLSVGEWSTYIAGLGTDEFNVFMHNRAQLYVPDISPHFKAIFGITDAAYRLSTSTGSSSPNDVAHIAMQIDGATIYEIVGPSSTLDAAQLTNFKAFSLDECPQSHVLVKSLDYYSSLYQTITPSDYDEIWAAHSGMYIPMGIGMSIPASSVEFIQDTVDLTVDIAQASVSTNTYGQCTVIDIAIPYDLGFQPNVRYVINSAAKQGTTYSLADWETQVAETHAAYLNMSSPISSWDRYLDTHIGVMAYVNEQSCDETTDGIEAVLSASEQKPAYSIRCSDGLHYYVGTQGVKAWEFNAMFCTSDATDICGCIANNNNLYYQFEHGIFCGGDFVYETSAVKTSDVTSTTVPVVLPPTSTTGSTAKTSKAGVKSKH